MDRLGQLVAAVGSGQAIDVVNARGASGERAAVEVARTAGRRVIWVARDVAGARAALSNIVHLDAIAGAEEPSETVLDRPETGSRVLFLPPGLHSPYSDVIPDRSRLHARMTVLFRISLDFPWAYLVLTAADLGTRVPPPDSITDRSDMIRTGMRVGRDDLVALLASSGYHRLPVVEAAGTFAVRGEIVDAWPPSLPEPARIEMSWDSVERIRAFDPETQRTADEIQEVFVHPVTEIPDDREARESAALEVLDLCDVQEVPTRKARALAEEIREGRGLFGMRRFLPAFHGTLPPLLEVLGGTGASTVFLENEDDLISVTAGAWRALAADFARLRASGEPAYEPSDLALSGDEVSAALARVPTVRLIPPPNLPMEPLPGGAVRTLVDLDASDHRDLTLAVRTGQGGTARVGSLRPLVSRLRKWIDGGACVTVTSTTRSGVDRLADLLAGHGLPPSTVPGSTLRLARGPLVRGYNLPDRGEVVISDQEIFGPRVRKARTGTQGRSAADDLRSLQPGDHVVHKIHGVGMFEGLVRRVHDRVQIELIKISYRDGDILYVPVWSLDQVQKFLGGTPARLDRLGGESLARVKERTRRAVAGRADRLLALYATRRAVPGRPLAPRDSEYREFEAQFPFEETRDQARAIDAVMADLEGDRPMDRLVCGDVGFGKTEVAIRAAYRVAMAGRQVAVLVPTTVLALQHLGSFRQRLAGTALRIEALSRFQSTGERREIVAALKTGAVDVVIGTHRLLSRDVHFRDLGLLVVDEEHRFGVAQKERIKFLAPGCDVLNLTATPIPRTLQMSLGDILDLSIIATPPVDRLAVETHMARRNDNVVREAILRELQRGGQVFFVHNRVQTIAKTAERLGELVPEARMAIGHGQMKESDLEQVMLDFVSGRVDVLVCTSIIESGLDIPNANTLIVDDAHTFGLAQLYQIRGRVGRSSEQAHAYLVVPASGNITDQASERLDTLLRFTELGSGFHVATMDLEIRGAGDLLGAEQSGHVRAVGFDLYCELLREAVDRIRGEARPEQPEPEMSFDLPGFIPEEYIDDPGQRLMLYKRMASAAEEIDVDETLDEMRDRFGPLPEEVRTLGTVMRLKVLVRRLKALGLEVIGRRVQVHLSPLASIDPARLAAEVQSSGGRMKLAPDLRLSCRLGEGEGEPLVAVRSLLTSLLDLAAGPVRAGGH